ncbi:hypothetical protein OUZ56_001671 [Daphnia magna]|uniref:Uncharacterized protein n=1 Tax=Daphnia magna TaxID=35525 RepID=A0ABR0A3W5_9CRUS|nr:hypothetical protein OUZ56_001671 [Daphnia magna]
MQEFLYMSRRKIEYCRARAWMYTAAEEDRDVGCFNIARHNTEDASRKDEKKASTAQEAGSTLPYLLSW